MIQMTLEDEKFKFLMKEVLLELMTLLKKPQRTRRSRRFTRENPGKSAQSAAFFSELTYTRA